MKMKLGKYNWEAYVNVAMILCICASLITALIIQLVWGELPCPLCLLQRAGFCAMGIALLMNLRFGFRPLHYSIVLLTGLFTMAVSLRQIVLHIIPGTGAYGSAVLGFHLYTWVFVAVFNMMLATSALLGSDRQYRINIYKKHWITVTQVLFALMMCLILANALTTTQICGFSACPGDPMSVVQK